MIQEEIIGDFRFQAQTIFRMYVDNNPVPVLTTSDKKLFDKQIEMAKSGQIQSKAAINKANPQ
jgi:hypothetical protein